MREITFRGKRIDDGKWVYGHYVHQYGANMIYLPNGVDCECGFDYYYIDPHTLGQYTGLTDKNGKKIFEGDIVKAVIHRCYGSFQPIRKETCIIGYDNLGMLGLKDKEDVWNDFMHELSLSGSVEDFSFEVIGNIHDHPELLKGGADNG